MRKTAARPRSIRAGLVALALPLLAAACGGGSPAGSTGATISSSAGKLVGLFKISPGTCSTAGVTSGSWFRMVQGGGSLSAGPFLPNGDSPCGDKTWTPLLPGTSGGFRTGAYQPSPSPAFDGAGNGTAAAIIRPVKFFSVDFALATNAVDPQSKGATTMPALTATAGHLTGDLRAFGVAWNKQVFNQGVPKPDGSRPGNTAGPTGTYDPTTHRYTLQWSSQIVGGPFNNFTGVWYFEGTFQPGA